LSLRKRLDSGFAADEQERDALTKLLKTSAIRTLIDRDEGAKADVKRVSDAVAAQAEECKQQAEALAKAVEASQRDLDALLKRMG
jgi:hypothetical protein